MGIIDTLKYQWANGSMLLRLIFINVGVFVLLHLITLVLMPAGVSADSVLKEVEFPSDFMSWLRRPWTLATYMFAQYDFLHILFNMLWLYWFGVIFLFTDTPRRMLSLYLACGIGGALLFMVTYNITGLHGLLIGSSASVIGIVTATAIRHPDYKMQLLFFGDVSLKWLAIITIAIDLFSIGGSNGGGHIAHIGGAITGALYAVSIKRGWFRPRIRVKKSKASNHAPKTDEATLDEILDKVKKSGYGALSKEEKQRLFDVSRRIK